MAAVLNKGFYVLLEIRQYFGWCGRVMNYSSMADFLVMACLKGLLVGTIRRLELI